MQRTKEISAIIDLMTESVNDYASLIFLNNIFKLISLILSCFVLQDVSAAFEDEHPLVLARAQWELQSVKSV